MTETKTALTGVLETTAGSLMFCLPRSEDTSAKRSCVQKLDCPLHVIRFGPRTFFFNPGTRLTYHSGPTVLNAPSRTTFGTGFGDGWYGKSLEYRFQNGRVHLLERDGRLKPLPLVEPPDDTDFEIEVQPDHLELQIVERAGYSFKIHAWAALHVASVGNTVVSWKHSGGRVSTASGDTVEKLLAWYEKNCVQ